MIQRNKMQNPPKKRKIDEMNEISIPQTTYFQAVPEIKQFHCTACMELHVRPVTLICGHTLCLLCLYRMQYDTLQDFVKMETLTCPCCRDETTLKKNPHFGVMLQFQHLIKNVFPLEYEEKIKEENEFLWKLFLYRKYMQTRFKKLYNCIRAMLRFRPIISYKELLEYIQEKLEISVHINELYHVLSFTGVLMLDDFCISNALNTGYGFSCFVSRFAIREYYAEKDKSLFTSEIPNNDEYFMYIGKALSFQMFRFTETVELNTSFWAKWRANVHNVSTFQSIENFLNLGFPESVLTEDVKYEEVIKTFEKENVLNELLKNVYHQKVKNINQLSVWSDWEWQEHFENEQDNMENTTLFSNDYKYKSDENGVYHRKYPLLSKCERNIAQKISPTIKRLTLKKKNQRNYGIFQNNYSFFNTGVTPTDSDHFSFFIPFHNNNVTVNSSINRNEFIPNLLIQLDQVEQRSSDSEEEEDECASTGGQMNEEDEHANLQMNVERIIQEDPSFSRFTEQQEEEEDGDDEGEESS